MSLRYFTDRTLQEGRHTDVGVTFELAEVPEGLW
jgi:hypothetical protein